MDHPLLCPNASLFALTLSIEYTYMLSKNTKDDAPLALPSMTMVARRCEWAVPCCMGPTARSPTLYVWVVNPALLGLNAEAVANRPVATMVAVNFIVAGVWLVLVTVIKRIR